MGHMLNLLPNSNFLPKKFFFFISLNAKKYFFWQGGRGFSQFLSFLWQYVKSPLLVTFFKLLFLAYFFSSSRNVCVYVVCCPRVMQFSLKIFFCQPWKNKMKEERNCYRLFSLFFISHSFFYVSVLLSAHVKKFSVSRMLYFHL